LSSFKDPVCIPCGHVYCKRCLTEYTNAPGNLGLTAKCPDCRASFHLVIPDVTCLPEKYHKFVSQNVRRIYVDFSSANSELRDALKAAEGRLARKATTEQALLKRCEELTEALNAHRQGERDANVRILDLEDDLANLENTLKENDVKAKESQRTLDLVVQKVNCLEQSNRALQEESLKLFLAHHDTLKKSKEIESEESNISVREGGASNQLSRLSASQPANTSSAALPPTRKQRKYIVRLPREHSSRSSSECTIQVSTSDDTPLAISMSTSRPVDPSRPIKPLPNRRGVKKRLIGDSSFMSIDVSDFV
jgi:hypothetical protein